MKGVYKNIFLRAGWIVLSVSFITQVYSQVTTISDSIINEYTKITSIHSVVATDADSVYVEDASAFKKNEVALFIVNRGAQIYTIEGLLGTIENMNNTGKYALIYIDTVEYDKNLVIFNSTLPGVAPLRAGESAQLVTVPRHKNALITNKLTCKAWNTNTGTGGVLALIVNSTLELQANIDVSAKGFLGAVPGDEKYEGSCSSADPGYSSGLFTLSDKDSAGLRGEGIIATNFLYPRGRLHAGNGGAGGNAKFSGGGGGSNAGSGGKGGFEYNLCSPGGDMGGNGGFSLNSFYSNTDPLYANRIYMGGGGGTSTQDPDQGKLATRGGNGGGMVIVLANKIIANGHSIKANGEAAPGLATAGAGGGGGGGVIATDIAEFSDNLVVEVMGGKGGDVAASPTDTTGPGGGGGGGVYWLNQNNQPINITFKNLFGYSGRIGTSSDVYSAGNGTSGKPIFNLILPRRGFIENRIPDDQVICENMVPTALNAPVAKGGNGGPYTYYWIQSEISNEGPWIPAVGINDQQTYNPPALTDTTFYSRIVSDGSLIDTSFAVRIAVHPALHNNVIIDNDTICAQLPAGVLTSLMEMSGGLGTGSYSYLWEESTDELSWQPASGANSQFLYDTPVLTETTWYRRKVSSGACVDTGNVVEIYVLPVLTNNIVSPEQIICFEQQPATLSGTEPLGGETGDRKYMWQSITSAGNWTDEVTTPGFSPAILTDTTWYRRIVYSGPGNTCVNISDSIEISVLPAISNNILFQSDTTICAGLPGITINAMQPAGGDGFYRYTWEKRPYSGGSWTVTQESAELLPLLPGTLNDSTMYRRIIKSGAADVCVNVSDSISVFVLPVLSGNTIEDPQLICENTAPEALTGSMPAGGTGTFIYLWQHSPDGTSNWEDTNPEGTLKDFTPPPLPNTTYFRRAVFSGPENTCENFSESLKIEIQPAISNNVITTAGPVFTCFNTQPQPITGSSNPAGGDGSAYNYTWLESDDMISWISGAQTNTQPDYQPEALTKEMYYRRLIRSGVCVDTTASITVKINALPVLSQLMAATPVTVICDDEDFRLKVTIQNGKAPYTAEYQNGIDPAGFIQNLATDTSSFPVTIYGAEPNAFNFTIISLTDDNGCHADEITLGAHQVPLDVYRAPVPKINMSDMVEVCGNSVMLEALPDVGSGYWDNTNPQVTIANPSDTSTNASFTIRSFNFLADKFYYIESTPGCGTRKDSVVVNFYEEPDDALITNNGHDGSPLIVFLSDNVLLTSELPTAGTGNWDILSGAGMLTEQNDTSAHLADLLIDQLTTVAFTITNGVCPLKTDEITVERKEVKVYQGFSPNGDLLNDYLYAEGINRTSTDMTYIFTIFNSSGSFVKELTHESVLETPDNDAVWDGKTLSGNLAGDGTYYYVLRLNYKGRPFTYKGFFVIKSE